MISMFDPASVQLTTLVLAAGLTVAAALSDLRRLRIPNRLCGLIAGLYPVYGLSLSVTPPWMAAALVAVAVLAVGFALFAVGFFGGGDVKLLAALALWSGTTGILPLLAITAVAGGLMALIAASPLKYLTALASEKCGNLILRDALLAGRLPYGLAIAAGGLMMFAGLAGTLV